MTEQEMMTKPDFISRIRGKYPVYNDISDEDLYQKVLKKYPVYKSQIIKEDVIPVIPEGMEQFLATPGVLPTAGMIAGGLAGMPFGGIGSIPGAGIGAGGGSLLEQTLRRAKGYPEKIDIKKAGIETLKGAGYEAAGLGLAKGLGATVEFLGGEHLLAGASRMSQGAVERILNRPLSVLSKKALKVMPEVQGKVNSALRAFKQVSGDNAMKEIRALAEADKFIPTEGIADDITKELTRVGGKIGNFAFNRIPSATKIELETIAGELKTITKLTLEEAKKLADYADDMVNFGKGQIAALGNSPEGNIFKHMADQLMSRVKAASSDYAQSAATSRQNITLYEGLRQKFNDLLGGKGEKYIKMFYKLPEAEKAAIKKLSDAVPDKLKFIDTLMDVAAKHEFTGNPSGFWASLIEIPTKLGLAAVKPMTYTTVPTATRVVGDTLEIPVKIKENIKRILHMK